MESIGANWHAFFMGVRVWTRGQEDRSWKGSNATDRTDQIAPSQACLPLFQGRDRNSTADVLLVRGHQPGEGESRGPIHYSHSNRSTVIGSIAEARLAGNQQTRTTAANTTTEAVKYAVTSNSLTP